MIYVEVLCTSGSGDDPLPSKQFQSTLRQTRLELYLIWHTFTQTLRSISVSPALRELDVLHIFGTE